MFERFTERARQVVVLSQEEARQLKHAEIGVEHILLGLFREHDGVAAQVLRECGAAEDAVRSEVARVVGIGEGEPPYQQVPFTPQAQKVFELALREALSLGHNYIGTEHILLGLVRDYPNPALTLLNDNFAIDAQMIRDAVVLIARGHHAQRNAERWEEYVICKKRGHVPNEGSHRARQLCQLCGTTYWTETVVKESGAPVDPAQTAKAAA